MLLKVVDSISNIDASITNFFEQLDDDFLPAISRRTSIDNYIKTIFANSGQLIVCYNKDEICGILGLVTNHPTWKYHIQYIAVEQTSRNKGVSQILLAKAEEIFTNTGANFITIRTWSTNEASNRAFTQFGFILTVILLDDREPGVHSHIYMKSLTDLKLKGKIQNLGILGGMGTYSTATFIDTISNMPRMIAEEQRLISYSLINDSTTPDRTTNILSGKEHLVVEHINRNVQKLKKLDISHLVVLCFTIHPYLRTLYTNEKFEFIDLLSFTSQLINRKKGRWLLAATNGTYLTKPFSDDRIFYPTQQVQSEIHKIIYNIKTGINTEYYKQQLTDIAKQFNCNGILLGCTDLHKMFSYAFNHDGIEIIDPLFELALKIHSDNNEAASN